MVMNSHRLVLSISAVSAVFKIVRLSQHKLESTVSLRDLPPRKAVNLNFSTLHIQWKPGSGESLGVLSVGVQGPCVCLPYA